MLSTAFERDDAGGAGFRQIDRSEGCGIRDGRLDGGCDERTAPRQEPRFARLRSAWRFGAHVPPARTS